MRAAIYDDFGQPMEIREVPDPRTPQDGVVVRVQASGLCRSDWLGWMGHDPDVSPPHVPGHEFAGVVEDVGQEAGPWSRGMRVTVPFVGGCGVCPQCAAGHPQVCDDQFQPGFTHWGSFAPFVAVHRSAVNLVELPPWLGFAEAASLGCRFVTAYRAVVEQGRVSSGEWVAVFGSGGVGTSAIAIARAKGASVVAVDVDPARLELARRIGARATVRALPDTESESGLERVVSEVRDVTGGGAHVGIDAFGSTRTCLQSILGLRKRGRHVQVGVLPKEARAVAVPMDRVMGHELEVLGSHGISARRYPDIFALLQKGSIDLGALVGRRIALDEVARGNGSARPVPRCGHGRDRPLLIGMIRRRFKVDRLTGGREPAGK